jgi:uncharacterized protein
MSPAADLEARAKSSPLFAKYGTRADPESAREKLAARMEASAKVRGAEAAQAEAEKVAKEAAKETAKAPRPSSSRGKASTGNPVLDFLGSRQGQAIGKEIVRGVFGMLKKRG